MPLRYPLHLYSATLLVPPQSGRLCARLGAALWSLVWFFVMLAAATPASGANFDERLDALRQRIDAVAAAVDDAEGYPREAARIDLQVARFFADYIAWELEHPKITKEALAGNIRFQNWGPKNPTDPQKRYRNHLNRELSGAMALLAQAEQRLQADGPWPEPPERDWQQMALQDGYFRIDGRPVFPGGFNMVTKDLVDLDKHPDWNGKAKKRTDRFLKKMRRLGVGVVGYGLSLPALVGEGGQIRTDRIQQHVEAIKRYQRLGLKVNILFHWGGDEQILENLWPGITRASGNGVGVDIDHPGTRTLIEKVTARLMPALKDIPAIVSMDMANEPFFSFERWSKHSLRRYHRWLKKRHDTIDKLNAAWQTDYARFEAIPQPKNHPREQISPGRWYDRISFHNHRTTAFFGFFQKHIRKYIPDMAIHLKAQDNSSLGPQPFSVTHGISRQQLTPLISLHGLDTRPLPVTEPRMAAANYDPSPYAFHWLGQSFLYDYLTSLPPRRPIVDFEYHAFSINAIRLPQIDPRHARASLWLAHLHGMIANMAWYWHRRHGPDPFPARYFKWWFYASLSTQPRVAAQYFHTMLALNTFSREVEALATEPDRAIRLLVSKPSYIQNQAHINALHRAYEGVCFHGRRVGFVTEQMLAEEGVPDDCRVLIIPSAAYVREGTLQTLKKAQANGVELLRFGDRQPKYDPYGQAHADETLRFLKDVPVIESAPAPALSRRLAPRFASLLNDRPLRLERVDRPDAFGVMHRETTVNGRRVMLLVNVFHQPVEVQLTGTQGRTVAGYDLLHREHVDGDRITIPVRGVRLIRVGKAADQP
jgi:hypothetical protein